MERRATESGRTEEGYSNALLEQELSLQQQELLNRTPYPCSSSSSQHLPYPFSLANPVPSTSYDLEPYNVLEASLGCLRLSSPSPSSSASCSRVPFLPSSIHNLPQTISHPQLGSMQTCSSSGRPLDHSYPSLDFIDRHGVQNCTCTCYPHQLCLPGNGGAVDWTMPAIGTSLQFPATAHNVVGSAINWRTPAAERSLLVDTNIRDNLLPDQYFSERQEVPRLDLAALGAHFGRYNHPARPRTHRNGAFVVPRLQRPLEVQRAAMINVGLERYNFLNESQGKIVRTAKGTSGGQYPQKVVEPGDPEQVAVVLTMVMRSPWEVMRDSNANYLFQQLVAACSELQQGHLLAAVIADPSEFLDTCCHNHGTRAVQQLVKYCRGSEEQRAAILHTLSPHAILLATHSFGNHVLQECFKSFPCEEIKFALEAIAANIVDVAKNKSGCCVVQPCLAVARGEAGVHLIEAITKNALDFSQDPYGNYVVKYLVENKERHVAVDIHRQLKGHYASLSVQKYSSNVVESCIVNTRSDERAAIIRELLESPDALAVMQDCFGNYVMQRALMNAEGEVLQDLVNFVCNHQNRLRSHLYGRNVIKWFYKRGNRRVDHLFSRSHREGCI